MKSIVVALAGLPIEVRYELGDMESFCRSYLAKEDAVPLFAVSATEEAVKKEVENCDEPTTPAYAEALCLYREIAEVLPYYDRVVFHGAAIEYGGKAYLFTAPSGTGKTTHISLWRRYLGKKVHMINGDKPILWQTPEGFTVYGTPYAGKEGWHRNAFAPLGGICLLSRGKENRIERAESNVLFTLLGQTYRPADKEAMKKTAGIVRELCRVPCFALSCDMSEEAVRTSFEAMTNEKYEVQNDEDQ